MPSFIVAARNDPELTSRCLETLLFSASRLQLPCEFILVDDASPPEEQIRDVFLRHRANAKTNETKIIRSRKHQHYSGVVSLGLAQSTHDVIFFISNDMIVTPSFLQALLLLSSLSRDFGIVRGTSNYVDSQPEHIVASPQPLRSYQDIDGFSRSVFSANGCRYVEDKLLSGDAILMKRPLLDRIGALDLRFFGYFGDVDFGLRAHLAGFKLVCAKGAWLFHEGSGHVKRDVARQLAGPEQARISRLALASEAYQVFRAKWNIVTPETWSERPEDLDLFRHAREQQTAVDLKYELPASIWDEIEFH